MSTEGRYVAGFLDALKRGNDSAALALLESGKLSAQSEYRHFFEIYGDSEPRSLIFPAVHFVREKVVRALVHLGVDIDTFRHESTGNSLTPAGEAICSDSVPSLSLCHSLGANMSCVWRILLKDESMALETAIFEKQLACLGYLLDTVYPARPIEFTRPEIEELVASAVKGKGMKACTKSSRSGGSTLRRLER